MTVFIEPDKTFQWRVPVLIVGSGACGLTAALAASDAGAEVLVLERDTKPLGLTGMSTGQIPAAGTRFQRALGIDDTPEWLAEDILRATDNQTDPAMALTVARAAGPSVEWLADEYGLPFEVIDDFLYTGHSRHRMHTTPNRSGQELLGSLLNAAATRHIDILTDAYARDLYADTSGRVLGLVIVRPDGASEEIGCDALILACNGFAANQALMQQYCPEFAEAYNFGHPGNTGEALLWGQALGAASADLASLQCHASIAHPHALQITWATMREGGFQVNLNGERFGNESHGYSDYTSEVLAQPEQLAWNIFDQRIHLIASQIDEYRQAVDAGAVKQADNIEQLAQIASLPLGNLKATFAAVQSAIDQRGKDVFGRDFNGTLRLTPPYRAVRVTGAVFMTQGGLVVNANAQVKREDGSLLPNLYAGGGSARGLAGPSYRGYLSGVGLLNAVVLGRLAGLAATSSVVYA